MATKNKLTDVRDHLFMALERLGEDMEWEQMAAEIERATAISNVAKVIVDSAKVEVDFIKATGLSTGPSDFILSEPIKALK